MASRCNTHVIRPRVSYSLSEIADLLDKDRKTCSHWVKEGLKVIEENARPLLIMGVDLINFIKQKKTKGKIPVRENEFLCMKCRKAVRAKIGSEQIIKTGKKIGKNNREQFKKIGVCENCQTRLNRYLGE